MYKSKAGTAAPQPGACGRPCTIRDPAATPADVLNLWQALPGPHWDVEFFHGHSQMSESLYRQIRRTCTEEELLGIAMPLSAPCEELITGRMTKEVRHYDRNRAMLGSAARRLLLPGALARGVAGGRRGGRSW